jgi:hypothetical protein
LTSNNGGASVSFTSRARVDKSISGWTWEVCQIQVQQDATSLTAIAYPGGAAGVDAGKKLNIAGMWLFEGDLPLAGYGDDDAKFLTTWYSDAAVKLHPTQGSGTFTAVGGDLEVTGATSPNSSLVFNLPPMKVGKTYRVSFDPVSVTGATGGFIFVRNGSNGGSSTIVTTSWLATAGVINLDFTGVATPVSVWIGCGGGVTAWRVDDMNVTQLP